MGWLDLKDGPVVIESPPNILGMVDDSLVPLRRRHRATPGPDQGKGGKFLFLPPGYKGEMPDDGYFVFQLATYGNWFGLRGFLVDGDPKPAVDEHQEARADLSAVARPAIRRR